ncbi:MAG TPA: LEA type 2 family protein [Steroidobacteraceae bacterium]|nr:LEA type 2 family protein [Steroidobacteraceae bacterium]
MHEGVLRRGALVALACLSLAGCATPFKLEAPKLSVISMKMQSADIFSQRLQIRMRVLNPNARELPIKGIEYRIEVNDAELAQGLADTPFVVPAMGEAEFDVQVTANLASALAKFLSRKSGQDTLDYRLIGSVALSSGFLRRIPFDERGSVKLK